jgi:hypothetical protein
MTATTAPDVDIVMRPATAADASALAEIERRSPMVSGDVRVTVDRGDDYFASARLMEASDVVMAEVDGEPAAVHCAAFHHIRLADEVVRVCYVHHLRVAVGHQGKGLFGRLKKFAVPRYPSDLAGSYAWVASGNSRSRGLAPDIAPWNVDVVRRQFDAQASAGPAFGRPATAADAGHIVDLINSSHAHEEFFIPYTVESLTARLDRAPDLYSWDKLWLTDGAVLGVWPAGRSIHVITETPEVTTVNRDAVVLDYGVAAGAEDDLLKLTRAWCSRAADEGLDSLATFTSPLSPNWSVGADLPHSARHFDLIATRIDEPSGLADSGVHVDQSYY